MRFWRQNVLTGKTRIFLNFMAVNTISRASEIIKTGKTYFSSNEFNIEVLKLLDREIAPNGYNLTIKATDNGLPAR